MEVCILENTNKMPSSIKTIDIIDIQDFRYYLYYLHILIRYFLLFKELRYSRTINIYQELNVN